jgi:hypothetical protein
MGFSSARYGLSLIAALLVTGGIAPAADAQSSSSKPAITVAPIMLVEPMVETPVQIQVGPDAAIPRNSFVRIKGLPPQAVFSDGHFVSAGTWALPLSGLAQLKVTVPLATTGRADLQIALVSIEGAVLAEARTTLAITAANIGSIATPQPTPPATSRLPGSASLTPDNAPPQLKQPPTAIQRLEPAPVPGVAAIAAPALRPEDRERAIKLLNRGDAELSGGDVAGARLLFQRAADAGLPEAAMAMGMTFDPLELARRGVKGLKGDPETARKWYARAQDMGAAGAAERIGRLPR